MTAVACLICGQPADSKEHYIPQWLSKASGRSDEVIIKGSLKDGTLQSAAEHGTAIEAFEKNLCQRCNNTLGNAMESPVSALLKPLMAGDFATLDSLTEQQRRLIAWWALLHALEHDFIENRLDQAPKAQLFTALRELVGGKNPSPPVDAHIHVAKAVHSEFGFFLSKQLIDRRRGSVQTSGSFCWGMQASHLIMSAARMPSGARPAEGWGFGVLPAAGTAVPTYEDIRYYYAQSKIETGLAVASGTSAEG